MDDLIEVLPSGPLEVPPENWTHTELLYDGARLGLLRIREILANPINDDMELREKRLIGEMGLGAAKLLGNLQSAAFGNSDKSEKIYRDILKTVAEIQAKGKPKQ